MTTPADHRSTDSAIGIAAVATGIAGLGVLAYLLYGIFANQFVGFEGLAFGLGLILTPILALVLFPIIDFCMSIRHRRLLRFPHVALITLSLIFVFLTLELQTTNISLARITILLAILCLPTAFWVMKKQ